MAVKLNQTAYDFATRLVREGRFVADESDDWSEHQPSPKKRTTLSRTTILWSLHAGTSERIIRSHKTANATTSSRTETFGTCTGAEYCQPRAGAGQRKYFDIEQAAAPLHGMIDAA
jgi:hypothetical protein